jgi:hypothetical protein
VASDHLPGIDFGGTVPAGVELYLIVGSLLDRHSRVIVWVSAPREAKGPVRLAAGREAYVQEQLAIIGELGDERLTAPANDNVPVGQELRVSLGRREELLGRSVLTQLLGTHLLLIKLYHDPAGLVAHLGVGAVIEDGDGAVSRAPSVVLEGALGARPHLEVALLPTQPPQDLAATAVYLVDTPGVAGIDEQIVVGLYFYGVYVEVVVDVVRIIGTST